MLSHQCWKEAAWRSRARWSRTSKKSWTNLVVADELISQLRVVPPRSSCHLSRQSKSRRSVDVASGARATRRLRISAATSLMVH
eukprot:679736-Pyramimonas_sp.AAC.1